MALSKSHPELQFIGPPNMELVEAHPEDRSLQSIGAGARWLIGLLTILPNFLFIAAVLLVSPLLAMFGIFAVFLVTGIVIDRVLRNSLLDKPDRALWIGAFLLMGPIAVPSYWWQYIRVPSEERTPEPTAEGLEVQETQEPVSNELSGSKSLIT